MSAVERKAIEMDEPFEPEMPEAPSEAEPEPAEKEPAPAKVPPATPAAKRKLARHVKSRFFARVLEVDMKVGRGELPSTEELELILLGAAFRKIRVVRSQRRKGEIPHEKERDAIIDDALQLIQNVYAKRTSAKFAPTNRAKAGGGDMRDI